MRPVRRALAVFATWAPLAAACSRPRTASSDSSTAASVAPNDSVPGAVAGATAPAPSPAAEPTKAAASKPSARSDSSPTTAAPRATPSATVLTGKVVAGGLATNPATSLAVEGGKPTLLVGPLEPELRRLGGATVWVSGAPAAGEPNASFAVSRYDIVSVDGAKPSVGLLSARNGDVWLIGETETVKLSTVPSQLAGKPGAKVWIVGRRSGSELAVQSYGIIRER